MKVPGPRSPSDVRWIRSLNDMLHAVDTAQDHDRTTVTRTHCGRGLDKLSWASFCGPSAPLLVLERAEPPICSICRANVDWVPDPDQPEEKQDD